MVAVRIDKSLTQPVPLDGSGPLNSRGDGVVTPPDRTLRASERPEAQLLLACARSKVDRRTAERIKFLVRRELNWDFVLNKTHLHRLTPLVYQSLSSVCPEEVPGRVLAELRDWANENARHNLYRTAELIKLLNMLESNGIPALPFKGPTLSAVAYGSLALREYGDLDILVNERHILEAKELFFSRGYRLAKLPPGKGEQSSGRLSSRKDLILESGDGLVRVELHWRLSGRHFTFARNSDRLWNQLQWAPLAGVSVRTLAPEALLLYLCLHGSRHHWERLLWVCDVAELIQACPELDWTTILEQAHRLGCRRVLALGLLLAQELLGTQLSDNIRREIHVDQAVMPLVEEVRERLFSQSGPPVGSFDCYQAHLAMRERARDRMRLHIRYYYRNYVRGAFIPNERDRAMLSLPASLSPLYFVLRPLRLLRGFSQRKS